MNNVHRKISTRPVSWFPLVIVILIFTSCAKVGHNYVAPNVSLSTNWHTQLKAGLSAEEMNPQILATWWTTLNDPILSSLMERAVAGNLDLKKARARIREARASLGIVRADFFPTLDATASATWNRSKNNGTSELYAANFDALWEMDIFGGVSRSVEAAEADLQSSHEDLRDVLVSLLAEIALNYTDVRTHQTRLIVVEANLEAQNETYQLVLWRWRAGLSDELVVQQARYNLESTRSQIPTLRAGLNEAMNRIAVLLGEQPGELHGEVEKLAPIPVTPLKVAVGVPADVLRRRPDVRLAERELAAQTARVDVAKSDIYPKFILSGSIGLEALSLSSLSSGTWGLSGGPQITWPIFRAGAIRQNIEVQSALQEQALLQYEAAILGAQEDVENALKAYAEEQQRRQSLTETVDAAQQAVELAQYKYQAGMTDFSNVLDAQRSLLSFQDQLAQSEGTVISNLIRLYKALGGGWTSMTKDCEKK